MDSWATVPELFRSGAVPLPAPWEAVFGPLRAGKADDIVVVGQLGQSLDGRVATPTGHSHYINGPAGLGAFAPAARLGRCSGHRDRDGARGRSAADRTARFGPAACSRGD